MANFAHGRNGEQSETMFNIIKASANAMAPRRASISIAGRAIIQTPHYLGSTSRGVIPHVSQDNFARLTAINGVAPYKVPPILKFSPKNGESSLRRFVALPEQTLLFLGARRSPPLAAPAQNSNTNSSVTICTAIGFRSLKAEDYTEDVESLGADVVIALGDIPYERALGSKRIEKAVDRNIQWLKDHVASRKVFAGAAGRVKQSMLFASLLPISCANQSYYIESLLSELRDDVHGLAIYDVETLEDLPKELVDLPRIGYTNPLTPHEILRHVALGIDLQTVPFISSAAEAGIALDFDLPPPDTGSSILPLGIDMWLPHHATDLDPIVKGCSCYPCTDHHRAYLQHLLNAKEMLGWVLLQIHNHAVMDRFFASIRRSIGNDTFNADSEAFTKAYEPQLPTQTGIGPRLRGYQFKSEHAGEVKKNAKAFNGCDGSVQKGDAQSLESALNAAGISSAGLAELREESA